MFNSHSLWANFKDLSKVTVFEPILSWGPLHLTRADANYHGRRWSRQSRNWKIHFVYSSFILSVYHIFHLSFIDITDGATYSSSCSRKSVCSSYFLHRAWQYGQYLDSSLKFRDDLVDFRLIFISIEPKMKYMTKRMSPEQKEHTLVIEKAAKNSQRNKVGKKLLLS